MGGGTRHDMCWTGTKFRRIALIIGLAIRPATVVLALFTLMALFFLHRYWNRCIRNNIYFYSIYLY